MTKNLCLFDSLKDEDFARVWMSLPLAARWRTVRTWEDIRHLPVREFDHEPRPGVHGALADFSVPNREPVGFGRTWFCEMARVCQVPIDLAAVHDKLV
jgi:hypothetical protein